jgi:hypothetical protein
LYHYLNILFLNFTKIPPFSATVRLGFAEAFPPSSATVRLGFAEAFPLPFSVSLGFAEALPP